MGYKTDPVFVDREVEMDNLEIVSLVGSVKVLREIVRAQPIYEASVDETGIANNENPESDMTVPQAYMTLNAYTSIIRELHSRGYRLVKGADHKPYFTPL